MKLLKPKSNELFCFSPEVMIATFILESLLALYVWLRKKSSSYQKLVIAMLSLLALFQLSEYLVCTGSSDNALLWSRIGYVAITFLPPIGLHIASKLAGNRFHVLAAINYGIAVALAIYFGLAPQSINAAICNGNYVIFALLNDFTAFGYGFYYYASLFAALFIAARAIPKNRSAGRWMISGYLLFIVPTAVVNVIQAETIHGVPSIMCGFAVLFAIILTFRVLPLAKQ